MKTDPDVLYEDYLTARVNYLSHYYKIWAFIFFYIIGIGLMVTCVVVNVLDYPAAAGWSSGIFGVVVTGLNTALMATYFDYIGKQEHPSIAYLKAKRRLPSQ